MAPINAQLVRFIQLSLSCLTLVAAIPFHAREADVKRQDELLAEYDFIVVGAGTAGLTVADRISASGQYTVLCVEYGYLDSSPMITATGPDAEIIGINVGLKASTRLYNITSAPLVNLTGTGRDVAAGAVVGGSSAVNGMVFDRGSAEDYDSWVWAAGDKYQEAYGKEWGWKNLLPWFRKSATFHPPTEQMAKDFQMTSDPEAAYGGSGPIHSSYSPYQYPAQQIMWNAFKAVPGVEVPKEHADGHAVGLIWVPNSIDPLNRTRSYARIGYYDESGAATRKNYHLFPGHRVTQLTLSEDKETGKWTANGVLITSRDGPVPETGPLKIKAKREIIVSAGTVHTPQVLQRSGIGPAKILKAANVTVKVELPGVGYNLQDHMHYQVGFKWTTNVYPTADNLTTNATFAAEARKLWDANKTGPLAMYVNSGAFLPLSVVSNRSDAIVSEYLAQDPAKYLPADTPASVIAGYAEQKKALARQLKSRDTAVLEWLFSGKSTFSLITIKQASRGTVHIAPNDDGGPTGRGNVEPIVDWRSFSNPTDLLLAAEFLKFSRWFANTTAMVEAFGPVETSPGTVVTTDAEIYDWLRRIINTSNGHLVGTAALAPLELGGVVGPDLKVYGVEKLSIADNSIVTIIPGTHTSSTAYAIGEKAADLILQRVKTSA